MKSKRNNKPRIRIPTQEELIIVYQKIRNRKKHSDYTHLILSGKYFIHLMREAINEHKTMNELKNKQDQQWNELSPDERQSILNTYKKAFDEQDNFFALKYQAVMNKRYGSHNLNPKPIRTWKDVKDYLEIIPDFKEIVHNLDMGCCDQKVVNKIIATYKISRIIELGYGGQVSDEGNKDRHIIKFVIVPCEEKDGSVGFEIYTTSYSVDKVVTFHSNAQAEEFITHDSNLRLLAQYYMM